MDEKRFAEQKSAIIEADVAVATFPGTEGTKVEYIILKGKGLIETIARSASSMNVKQCIVSCRSRVEAMTLLEIFKDW